jgi:hypothetical protein
LSTSREKEVPEHGILRPNARLCRLTVFAQIVMVYVAEFAIPYLIINGNRSGKPIKFIKNEFAFALFY